MQPSHLLGLLFLTATLTAYLLQLNPIITGSLASLILLTLIYEAARILAEAPKTPSSNRTEAGAIEPTSEKQEDEPVLP